MGIEFKSVTHLHVMNEQPDLRVGPVPNTVQE